MNKLTLLLLVLVASCTQKSPVVPGQDTDHCASISRDSTLSVSSLLEGHEELMRDKTGVYVLEDGAGSMVTRAWFSEYAEQSIDIQYFIFSTDNVGLIACDYLVRAADRGVKVRILVDDIMVDADIQDVLTLNSHENIDIKIYNPGVNLGKNIFKKLSKFSTDFRSANQRMHNKTFIVDQKLVITGGRNIANEYFDYDHAYNFRDRDVLLMGKTIKSVNESFIQFWTDSLSQPVTTLIDGKGDNVEDEDRFDNLHQYACNPDNFSPTVRKKIDDFPTAVEEAIKSGRMAWVDSVAFISDAPGKNSGSDGLSGGGISTDALIELIQNAESTIDIQSPYLVTTEVARGLFKTATDRGVKIRILTNSLASTDNLEAFSGYQRDREKLLETGVQIFEFKPDAKERFDIMTSNLAEEPTFKPIFGLHAKTMVVDGNISVIGTFNLDPRSANLNTECVAIIHSEEIAQRVMYGIEEEFKPENSWETTLDFNPDDEVGVKKQIKTWSRKIVPKGIL